MIERILYLVLENVLKALREDQTLIDEVFSRIYQLEKDEVAGIKRLFAKPIEIRQGYAHADATMPMFTIILAGEQQSDFVIGDSAGMTQGLQPFDPAFGCDQIASIWDQNFQILCYSENPDQTRYMYEAARSAFLVNRTFLAQNGLLDPAMSGMDLTPDPRYLPDHLFCRVLSIRTKSEFVLVDYNSRAGRAFQITGLAVDPASPNSNGGVPTDVTVVT